MYGVDDIMNIDLNVIGDKETVMALNRMSDKMSRNFLAKGARRACRVFKKQIETNASSMVGGTMGAAIKAAVYVGATRKRPPRGTVNLNTMLEKDDSFVSVSKAGQRNYIPAAIEYGHDNAAPIPFGRKAFDTKKVEALNDLLDKIDDEIQKEAKKKK